MAVFASDPPRLFGVPPGADFCRAFVEGLDARLTGDPMRMARTVIYVNTRRTGRRMAELMAASGARLLPRIVPVAELGVTEAAGLPPPVPGLRRRLELAQVVRALLDRQPDLAPRAAAFDLADSLAALMDEMADEAVEPETLIGQDFGDLSKHWEKSAEVLSLIARYFGPDSASERTAAGRLAAVVGVLTQRWDEAPPQTPVIVAGSTGSRGSTHALMRAVERLPQGAVVLPGFDFDLPGPVWDVLVEKQAEDHPQFRFARLCQTLDATPAQVARWSGEAGRQPRNRLMSLALRPAPVSDQWIEEGPKLDDLLPATEGMTLIEAPGQRLEALAIALALREAVEKGQTAAVVTPDRRLTRAISAELDRWRIVPDDSAGEPLAQSAAGRLLRLTAEALSGPMTGELLLTLLKHPLVHSGTGRGRHLARVRALELKLRRVGHPSPDAAAIRAALPEDAEWTAWVTGCFGPVDAGPVSLADRLIRHIALAEGLAAGVTGDGDAWSGPDGAEARRVMAVLEREADHGGALTAVEYRDLVNAVLARGEVRQAVTGHPQVRLWGTIEARVQGADLVILAGLNEGVWPALPPLDPWMNRAMRRTVGLTSPERRIGLSAHDFQQAASAGRVMLTRSVRVEAAETVPSRWLSRLTNLLDGLEEGIPALEEMRARGRGWLQLADAMDLRAPEVQGAKRPAPRPPVGARPDRLSVTEIETLIRDPYAVYARRVLGLEKLDPLRPEPDAPLKGSAFHAALERFVKETLDDPETAVPDRLVAIATEVLADRVAWPGMRQVWQAKIAGFAEWFASEERNRRQGALPVIVEKRREIGVPGLKALVGKPDRIDLKADGTLEIVDYKSGSVPARKDVDHFDRQLMLLALMAEAGAFGDFTGSPVSVVTHYGLSKQEIKNYPLAEGAVAETAAQLERLLAAYLQESKGYPAGRSLKADFNGRWRGDYLHLARYGEWSLSDEAEGEDVG